MLHCRCCRSTSFHQCQTGLPSIHWQDALIHPTSLCSLRCRVRTFHEPVKAFICEKLPEHKRQTSHTELQCEDIKNLPISDIASIAWWLTEKVASVTKICAEPKGAEELVG